MRPGALVWNQGAEAVETLIAHPNPSSSPPMIELTIILSIRMCALFVPSRDISSIVWAGVKGSIFKRMRWLSNLKSWWRFCPYSRVKESMGCLKLAEVKELKAPNSEVESVISLWRISIDHINRQEYSILFICSIESLWYHEYRCYFRFLTVEMPPQSRTIHELSGVKQSSPSKRSWRASVSVSRTLQTWSDMLLTLSWDEVAVEE